MIVRGFVQFRAVRRCILFSAHSGIRRVGICWCLCSQNKLTAPGVNRRVRGKTLHRLYAIFTHLYIQGTWRKRQKQNNSVWNEGKVEATLLTYSLSKVWLQMRAHIIPDINTDWNAKDYNRTRADEQAASIVSVFQFIFIFIFLVYAIISYSVARVRQKGYVMLYWNYFRVAASIHEVETCQGRVLKDLRYFRKHWRIITFPRPRSPENQSKWNRTKTADASAPHIFVNFCMSEFFSEKRNIMHERGKWN